MMKKGDLKKYFSIGTLVLLLALAILIWYRRLPREVYSIPAKGGEFVEIDKPDQGPFYRQNDPKWKDMTIGGSEERFAVTGCTVCCVSMSLAHHGIDLPPDSLNKKLKDNEGFTGQGWLKWNSVTTITDGNIKVFIPEQPSHKIIDEALMKKETVITKIMISGVIPHWVLIVGKDKDEYLIKDPMGPQKLKKLSSLDTRIYSIRILKRI